MFLKTKSTQRPQIIINPESDKGRTGKRWKHIKEALRSIFNEYRYEFTEKPSHATEISRSAIMEGAELIVGIGGDGTMNEIANGFFENDRILNPDTALGVVPSGTGSDLSRSLRIPQNLKNALKLITEVPSHSIDAGKVTYHDHGGMMRERMFLNISDFGIGGEVVRHMNMKKMERKKSSYMRSSLTTFLHYKNKKLRIKVDGQDLPEDEYMIGAIANGQVFGKGMKAAPDAELDDGLFDVLLVKGMKLFEFLRTMRRLYSGTHLPHPRIDLLRSRSVEVTSPPGADQEVYIEVDGEQVGKVPVNFEVLPQCFPIKANLLSHS
jgi:YegS/Rv2252/BmrU family lipid kinase